ncbi:hypothetical protein JW721_02605 [Candidatus Micrarchaeota archaeon]|nr:hypothetical protein [Candidatus Micrarchaeota archaeon]
MAGRQLRKQEKSEKLSLKPALEISYVEEQLKGAAGYVPYAVSKEVAQSGDTSKIREIRDSLSKIAKATGSKPKSALRVLADKNLARMFVANPEEFVKMAKAAKEAARQAFMALRKEPIAMVFEAGPGKTAEYFVKIAKAAKGDADDAFRLLSRDEVAASFAWGPNRMMDAFSALCAPRLKDKTFMFWFLEKNGIREEFAKDPIKYATALAGIANAGGKNAPYAFYVMNKGSLKKGAPMPLLTELFASEPLMLSGAISEIFNAAGEHAGAAFYALEKFTGDFYADPEGVSAMFVQMCKTCGRRAGQFFELLKEDKIADALMRDASRALELAEASTYTNILYHLEKHIMQKDTGSIAGTVAALDDQDKLESEYKLSTLPVYRGQWREGRKLALEAGVTIEDKEVFLNFAYAKETIGAQKAKAIHREYGIEYFARYSEEELENLYDHIGERTDERPLLLIAQNKNDFNGTFYHSLSRKVRKPMLEDGHYNVIFFEAESEYEFYELAKKFSQKYFGISALWIGGHGEEGSVRFGPGWQEENFLDLRDEAEMAGLHGLFAKEALVILDSCSTGANEEAVGALISRLWGAELFAPKLPTNMKEVIRDGDGRITDVQYYSRRSHFKNGKRAAEKE